MIYSQQHQAKQEAAKYQRMKDFADALPRLRCQVEQGLKLPGFTKDKVLATAVSLISHTYFRVGNHVCAK